MSRIIADEEEIVRSVNRHWVKKGKLQYSAFRPSTGKTLISVIAASEGADYCKNKSVEIHKQDYLGLAVLQAGEVRALGALVVDAPDDFRGHAHIDHVNPPVPPSPDPLDPAPNREINDRCKALARQARYFEDSDSTSQLWPGPTLV